ncbi:MAG: MarR family transcriptional regulator [Natronospirillum sp.]
MSSAAHTQPSEHLFLRNQVCHSLYSVTNALVRAYRPLLEPLGLTYPQYLVMLALWEQDDVPIKRLVEQTRLDSGTLTPILKRLEQKQLIQRYKGRDDERQWLMQLTDDGHTLRTQAEEIPLKLWCLSNMTKEDAFALKLAAERMYEGLVQQESATR